MMSFWDKIASAFSRGTDAPRHSRDVSRDASRHCFVDVEVGLTDRKIHDIGALRWDDAVFHSPNKHMLTAFLNDVDYICGHNIINHDAKYLFDKGMERWQLVDTLYFSPLLFPERPYHHLLKDDKLMSEQMNNPVNDCEKARDLLMSEAARWSELPPKVRDIYAALLLGHDEFEGFLHFVGATDDGKSALAELIRTEYSGKICAHADIESLIHQYPRELAYALALASTSDHRSITPPWVLYNFPNVENVMRLLCDTTCAEGCDYCNEKFDVKAGLRTFFGYDNFRVYGDEPLQEQAVRAAVNHKSLLVIFPTGGGKSLTFQLPALMEGRSVHGLTVVISPLQSLMKDQVDNLAEKGIIDAVTINGLLDPISRAEAINRVMNGDASLLYIAPEMLRSKTIEKILLARHIVRVVIDEAHCFSAWGQDFRVDYLYIGEFFRRYQEKKKCVAPIPVSCFTATAKHKVIQDICDYFRRTLNLDLQIYASSATRDNLRYSVIRTDTDDEKYTMLRSLISSSSCPVIVYVSRTKRTVQLAQKLTRDGYKALPFNGRMEPEIKVANQDAFMSDDVRIIVATSAFGMGVDKKDVGMVIHYDISDSLENYIQESGRAGRDPHLHALCYVLYCDSDLDKHFILLNQTKLSISEIRQVWTAVKSLTKERKRVCCSGLEIARAAGWNDLGSDMETRVRTALAALEQAGYLTRGNNVPHVYATGITVKNLDEARKRIEDSSLFDDKDIENAVRIIKSLLSTKYIAKAQADDSESRIDYLADILGLSKSEVISCVVRMRQEGILADTKDISAFLNDTGSSENKSKRLLDRFLRLERYILDLISEGELRISCKMLNDRAIKDGVENSTEKDIRTLLYFLSIKGYARKKEDAAHNLVLSAQDNIDAILFRFEKRMSVCRFAIGWLYRFTAPQADDSTSDNGVRFSVIELLNDYKASEKTLSGAFDDIQVEDVEEALLYLTKIGALKLEGGFLVLYNAMDIRRVKDSRLRYKQEDYRLLDEFYKQKIQQVHIVGEYANLMVSDYDAARQYVHDYFCMDYKRFISKYFKGERLHDIERNVTPGKYNHIFGALSPKQMEIISDNDSHCIVVAAGPGSGKTRVLVHKLASLLLLEDVKHEQLLMLTFSRAAACEFKQRLMALIGNAAHFVEIKTFHSYSFDLMGKVGSLDEAKGVVSRAARMIACGEVEPNRIAKSVLVIDEAQDMSSEEYALVHALMSANEEMRVIAVGDDDQNIFQFRGADSGYMAQLLDEPRSRLIEMSENYRSARRIVDFANAFVSGISRRMKTAPIVSMNGREGLVCVRHHASHLMFTPLVDDVLKHHRNASTCILTQTNEEVAVIVALLRRHGLKCKAVQSMEGFRFCNLAETRMFLRLIKPDSHSAIIPDDVWENAKAATSAEFAGSTSLQYLQKCIALFEKTNKCKYYTDFIEYVFESSVDDFSDFSDTDIVVSTFHKAKGREFDDVFMLISRAKAVNDDALRRYYVGITRAKERLFIHTDSFIFDHLPADEHQVTQQQYDMPDEVMLQLSHKDVNLGFFKSRKKEILALRAGRQLRFFNNYLYDPSTSQPVAQLSQKMRADLLVWSEKGYNVVAASVRFIVAWRPKDAPREEEDHAVLLIDLTLRKCAAQPDSGN